MYKLRKSNPRSMMIGAVVLIVVLLAIIGALTLKYTNLKKDPQAAAKATTSKILNKVGELYELPTGEEPTVAQVQDKAKLRDQPFFEKAQNGDYILVYTKNKLAIIYREKINKLINVGPINTEQVNNQATSKTPVSVLNGSGNPARLSDAVSKLNQLGTQIALASATPDAKNKNTPKTIVVDVTGQNPALAKTIADKLGGKLETSVPAPEAVPSGAAIVVIVGKS
jgi:hypothetical protein